MDSSASLDQHAKSVPKQCDTFLLAGKYPSSRRTPSFSSCSSSLSPSSSSLDSFYIFPDDPLLSPASPLRFSGVPFSWEHLPGIPKKQNSNKKKESSMKLLPLPPPTTTTTHTQSSKKLSHEDTRVWKKNSIQSGFQKDPFFAAMVECSKDDHHEEETRSSFWNGTKVSTRSISDRFGFISLYSSCKRTCAVSESLVYLPSSRRSTYEHVTRRSL